VDPAKDQSYVLHMLGQAELAQVLLPIGELTKAQVRELAAAAGLPTAGKPDSQDVCFVPRASGRAGFLGSRIALRPGRVVDTAGEVLGQVDAVQLVTVGQRRGLGNVAGSGEADRRYALAVDSEGSTVTVGSLAELLVDELPVRGWTWVGAALDDGAPVEVQTSAHGAPVVAVWNGGGAGGGVVRLARPVRRVAPGQSVVAYRGNVVLGGGIAA
jgi:tRNA-uridine 2-sulfurtransferase